MDPDPKKRPDLTQSGSEILVQAMVFICIKETTVKISTLEIPKRLNPGLFQHIINHINIPILSFWQQSVFVIDTKFFSLTSTYNFWPNNRILPTKEVGFILHNILPFFYIVSKDTLYRICCTWYLVYDIKYEAVLLSTLVTSCSPTHAAPCI